MKSSTKFILEDHTVKLQKKKKKEFQFVILYWVSFFVILDHVCMMDTPCENQASLLFLSHVCVQGVYANEYACLHVCGHIRVCRHMYLWRLEVDVGDSFDGFQLYSLGHYRDIEPKAWHFSQPSKLSFSEDQLVTSDFPALE